MNMDKLGLFQSIWHLFPATCVRVGEASPASTMFHPLSECRVQGREKQSVVSDLDGTLVKSSSSFPYYMLMAFEAGSPLRALLLLLLSPLTWFLHNFISEEAGLHLLIFVSLAGLKAEDVSMVGRAVLPKFYLQDLHPLAYNVFVSCGKRYVVTANPRMIVEPFLKEYLNVDGVVGTELQVIKGFCTGLVASPGVLLGWKKHNAVKALFGDKKPDVALGNRPSDFPFMFLAKEAYVVPVESKVGRVGREEYLKPLVFHDGRLAIRPTPVVALGIFLWFPVGILLALARLYAGICLPYKLALPMVTLLGVRIRVKGVPPLHTGNRGILYVCSHRTLLDPVFLTTVLGKPVTAVTYSISRMSEILAPIKTVRLSRNRARDGQMMSRLLKEGDLVVCPEGTTCREPYLLRFSSLFAELTDLIVPVTMDAQVTLFHGTTARGWKCLDPIFFLMNPSPCYHVAFLDKLPHEMSCSAGKSSFQVANHIQKTLADALGFQCTNFTRKDKYTILAGNQGLVSDNAHFGFGF